MTAAVAWTTSSLRRWTPDRCDAPPDGERPAVLPLRCAADRIDTTVLCGRPPEIVDVKCGDLLGEGWMDHGRHGTRESVGR
jgi:hypothetical protein